MADDINRVNMTGRLTRDSELKYTGSGIPILVFSIAVNRSVKKGEAWDTAAYFFDVAVWGRRGEALVNYLKKGTQLAVEGEMRQESWEQDGYKRSRVLIEVKKDGKILMMGGKAHSESTSQSNNRKSTSSGNNTGGYTPPERPTNQNDFEDDIPF